MTVSISNCKGEYPLEFPYNPSTDYPEYKGEISESPNYVYEAVRNSFILLDLDKNQVDTKSWNPFGEFIKPGDKVFVKPNLVASEYRRSCKKIDNVYTTITHPSVIRVVLDYVFLALKGEGKVILGDNPSIDANFSQLCKNTGIDKFEELYKKTNPDIEFRVLDLRPFVCTDLKYYGFASKMEKQSGDPEGETVVNLAKKSLFYGLNYKSFRGIFTKRKETIKHHKGEIQEYAISNSIYTADVYISIPKLKTHRKVGTTLNLKGLVGICSNKNYLVHWRIGYPKQGGDEYPDSDRWLDYPILKFRHFLNDFIPEKIYFYLKNKTKGTFLENTFQTEKSPSGRKHRGAWEGNDSCWRMVVDLFNAFVKDLPNNKNKKTKTFSVIDGILAGEGNGPFCPEGKSTKIIISGNDLLETDLVTSRLMDFDISAIKYLKHLVNQEKISLDKINIYSDSISTENFFKYNKTYFNFKPPNDWPSLIRWKK